MKLADIKALFIETAVNCSEDRMPRIAAAFSFYAMLALAPLLIVVVAVAGMFLGTGSVQEQVVAQAQEFLGEGSAELIDSMIARTTSPGTNIAAIAISLGVSLFAASSLFMQLSDSVNTMWGVRPTGNPILAFIKIRALAILMVFLFILILIAWLVLDSWLGVVARNAGVVRSGWPMVSFIGTTLFLFVIFSIAYMALPKTPVRFRDVWFAALLAAMGVAGSKFLLALYFTFSTTSAAYGSAGALFVMLLWVYYTAQVFFFGTELSYTYAHRFGSRKGIDDRASTHLEDAPPVP